MDVPGIFHPVQSADETERCTFRQEADMPECSATIDTGKFIYIIHTNVLLLKSEYLNMKGFICFLIIIACFFEWSPQDFIKPKETSCLCRTRISTSLGR